MHDGGRSLTCREVHPTVVGPGLEATGEFYKVSLRCFCGSRIAGTNVGADLVAKFLIEHGDHNRIDAGHEE